MWVDEPGLLKPIDLPSKSLIVLYGESARTIQNSSGEPVIWADMILTGEPFKKAVTSDSVPVEIPMSALPTVTTRTVSAPPLVQNISGLIPASLRKPILSAMSVGIVVSKRSEER